MTWFLKTVSFWATLILLGYTMEVMGYTLFMCKRDCKDQPDEPVCGRWNFTMEDQHRTKSADFQWLRNECERKCFSKGEYKWTNMSYCTDKGQNHSTYLCQTHKHNKKVFRRCLRNESLYQDYE